MPDPRRKVVAAGRSGLDDARADGVAHEAGGLMNIQLLHESGAMSFGCFYRDAKQRRDVFSWICLPQSIEALVFRVG